MKARRYMGPISSNLRPEADGQWVTYADHLAVLEGLVEEMERRAVAYAEDAEGAPEDERDELRVAEAVYRSAASKIRTEIEGSDG